MTQTIKQHLDAIRSALHCVHSTDSPDYCDCVTSTEAIEYLDEITSMLDAPMKSAEEWARDFVEHLEDSDFGCRACLEIISAIQQDARISPQPVVDRRKLAADSANTIAYGLDYSKHSSDLIEDTINVIHAVLIKATEGGGA